jgi:hypothetical protein
MYRQRSTTKLFYKKYPYKIHCKILGGYLINRVGLTEIKKICNDKNYRSPYLRYWNPTRIDRNELLKFVNAIEPYLFKEIKVRVEASSEFVIYVEHQDLFDKLVALLDSWIFEVSKPKNIQELQFLIENNHKKVICKYLPHKKYQYRIHITSKTNLEIREQFLNWSKNYGDKILIPNSTKEWFNNINPYFYQPTIYIQDSGLLSIVGIFLSNSIWKVEEFVPRSSINIITDQEITCQH